MQACVQGILQDATVVPSWTALHVQIVSAFNKDGIPSDWDVVQAVWDHAFK
jgi:hypothetical protein